MKRFRILLALVLAVMMAGSVSATNVRAAGRLSVDTKTVTLETGKKATVKVTLKGRKKGEKVSLSFGKKGIATVKKGTWNKGVQELTITAKKAGTVRLTVASDTEKVRVKITVKEPEKEADPDPEDPPAEQSDGPLSAEEVYSKAMGAMVEIDCFDSFGEEYIGAGFFIDEQRILTNEHVIGSAVRINVKDYSGKSYTIKNVEAVDEFIDLAVLSVSQKSSEKLVFSKDTATTGDTIYTIGSPYGYTGTFSRGIVSLEKRTMDELDYIQITAAMSQGSGGGPLLNTKGEVLGVNTLTVRAAQNVNFALMIKYFDKLEFGSPIAIADYMKGNADKSYTSMVVFNSEKKTSPGIGVLSAIPSAGRDEKELTAGEVYTKAKTAVVEITSKTAKGDATGSGFFFGDDLVMTNYHVIENSTGLTVTDINKKTYKVLRLESWDTHIDMAILRVENTSKHGVLEIDASYLPATGETIYTLGSPYWYTGTFSDGIVSMTESYLDKITYFQIEAPITKGSSGGPLINKYGRVIGLTTASFTSAQNLNYALRIAYMYKLGHTEGKDIADFYAKSAA